MISSRATEAIYANLTTYLWTVPDWPQAKWTSDSIKLLVQDHLNYSIFVTTDGILHPTLDEWDTH